MISSMQGVAAAAAPAVVIQVMNVPGRRIAATRRRLAMRKKLVIMQTEIHRSVMANQHLLRTGHPFSQCIRCIKRVRT